MVADAPEIALEVERLLSPAEAGREIGVTTQSIGRLIEAGKLAGYRSALGWLVTPESVEREKARRAQVQAGRRRRG